MILAILTATSAAVLLIAAAHLSAVHDYHRAKRSRISLKLKQEHSSRLARALSLSRSAAYNS